MFVLQARNRFQALLDLENYSQEDQNNINQKWDKIKTLQPGRSEIHQSEVGQDKTAYLHSGKECLGTKERKD